MAFFSSDERFDPWCSSTFGLIEFRMSFMIFPEIQSCNFSFGLIEFRMSFMIFPEIRFCDCGDCCVFACFYVTFLLLSLHFVIFLLYFHGADNWSRNYRHHEFLIF